MLPHIKRPELSPQLRGRILELNSLGWFVQKVATKHRLAKSNVQYTATKAKGRSINQEGKQVYKVLDY